MPSDSVPTLPSRTREPRLRCKPLTQLVLIKNTCPSPANYRRNASCIILSPLPSFVEPSTHAHTAQHPSSANGTLTNARGPQLSDAHRRADLERGLRRVWRHRAGTGGECTSQPTRLPLCLIVPSACRSRGSTTTRALWAGLLLRLHLGRKLLPWRHLLQRREGVQ